jgi:ElaB/YqjD/DUF883 family membrane-anchored ribosome-binding protein
MSTQILDSINTGNAVAKSLKEDLRFVAADAEKLLRTTSSQIGEDSAVSRAPTQNSLTAIKACSAASEAAVIEHTRQAAKMPGQYVHDNHWNWH